MLQQLTIKNFQSLTDVALELAPLTVIVGPSSSGKSALTRAIKTLTSNARGTSYITHGEQACTITAHTDRGVVSLTKGKKDEYTLIPSHSEKKSFTKLGGAVPEEVSEFLQIPAKDPLNYSSQFDMPYLLTASAGEVARTLGELTNVHVIFEAAREANRQRLAATQKLKTRTSDLQQAEEQLERFKNLEDQQAAISEAQQQHATADQLGIRLDTLRQYITTIREAHTRLSEITTQQEIPSITTLTEVHKRHQRLTTLIATVHTATARAAQFTPAAQLEIPSISTLQAANKKFTRLAELIRTTRAAEFASFTAGSSRDAAAKELDQLRHQYTDTLHRAGTCPTCGQTTKEITHGH